MGEAVPPLPIELEDMAQPKLSGGSNCSEAKPGRSQPGVEVDAGRDGGNVLDIWGEYVGQGDGTGTREADEATQGLEAVRGDVEHASATPMRQKRFFKDLSPLVLSPPDSGDGVISPLQGGAEGRHVSRLPSVFDNGRTESAAGDLDVEAGMDEANGRLPNTGGAQAGQGDGDGAAVVSEGSTKSGGMADWDGESESVTTAVRLHPDQPENWSSLSKSQQRHWWRQRKRIHDRGKG